MKNLSHLSQLLSQLVAIPSINPRLKHAASTDNEIKLGEFIKSTLTAAGIRVVTQEVELGRCNVIGSLARGEKADDKIILLSAHMDTYPASFDADKELTPRIEGTRLIGRGSADAKGSLAAMMNALLAVAHSAYRRECYFVASIDEEHELKGAKKLTEFFSPKQIDLAITGEPTQLIPIIMQKGIIRSTIRMNGDIGHAAYPKSKNSLFAAGKLLECINHFNQLLKIKNYNPLLSAANITPTKIIGDGDMNLTPAETTLWFDARFSPEMTETDFLTELTIFLQEHMGEHSFEINFPHFVSPANTCSVDDLTVKEFFSWIKQTTGQCDPEAFSYGSEAGVLSKISKASLVFGPGDPKYSHKADEQVDLEEVNAASEIFKKLLTSGHE